MELPQNVKSELNELEQLYGLKALQKAAEEISLRYRSAQRSGKPLLTTNIEAAAYALSRMPATFGAVSTALSHVGEVVNLDDINSVCDLGAGTGAATIAVTERCNPNKITCIEKEPAMLQLGTHFAKGEWLLADTTAVKNLKADLVVSSYMFNELAESSRATLLKDMAKATNKLLLIVENGTPEGFKIIKEIGEKARELGLYIAAPCPDIACCPIAEGDWCHFTCRVARSRVHKLLKGGDAPYEDEKFCYIALTTARTQPVTARILRHPKVESGKITLKLCTSGGITQKIQTKKDKEAFKAARKAAAGNSFNY